MGKMRLWIALVITAAVACECSEDDADSYVRDGLEMDCDGEHLFNAGVSSISWYDYEDPIESELGDDLVLTVKHTYEYDSEKRLKTVVSESRNTDGDLEISRVMHITYEDRDLPVLVEYEYNGEILYRRVLKYKNGRLEEDTLEVKVEGEFLPDSVTRFEYDDRGRPLRFLYPSDVLYSWEFEYDELGRLDKKFELDAENDHTKTGRYIQLEYDELNRFIKDKWFDEGGNEQESGDGDGCQYHGQTGWITQCVSENLDGDVHTTLNEYDDMVLTSSYIIEQNGEEEAVRNKNVVEYTSSGNSAYFELVMPVPGSNWIYLDYGNGFINGCVGQ